MDNINTPLITFKGLPLMGEHNLKEGMNQVAAFRDCGTTVSPCYVIVEDSEVVAYGMQPHVMLWEKSK